MVRPNSLPVPAQKRVSAYTAPQVVERWSEIAAGVRPVALATGDNVITMFEEIGEDFWTGGGITAKSVAAQLRAIGDRPVEVHINSFGGDMFEGIAIYNVLREHAQPITVKIMGMAASAASIIAMAGDEILIGAASFFMIHNCWVFAVGNRKDLAEAADWLRPFDQAMAEVYAARSGQSIDDVASWMDKETYMSGSEAIARGFAEALLPADASIVDETVGAAAKARAAVTAVELTLCAAGKTRTEARAAINQIKGTPGAAPCVTPGADAASWVNDARELITAFRS